jgi:hypothetical protein
MRTAIQGLHFGKYFLLKISKMSFQEALSVETGAPKS